jgi:hypothetical protein
MEKLNQKKNKAEQSVKAVQINEAIKKFENTADALGLGIDKGVIEQVAVLDLLGYFTTASCEGHINSGLPYGWIDFGSEIDRRERELDKKGESTYWNVINTSRKIATELTSTKFEGLNKYNEEADEFWNDSVNFQIKNDPDYIKYKKVLDDIKNERENTRNSVAILINEYNNKNPEHKICIQKKGLVRISFKTDDNPAREFNEEERVNMKNKSDLIANAFKKFLQEKYYENLL